jgi:lysophospholipase L1-like esterase
MAIWTQHRRWPVILNGLFCICVLGLPLDAKGQKTAKEKEAAQVVNTTLVPVERLEIDNYDWYARHQAVLALQQTMKPRVVLIGDSITHRWGGVPEGPIVAGPQSYERVFGAMSTLNMGFGYDRIQNVLWRLREGEFTDVAPEWVVINIGTNNMAATDYARANTPVETATGIEEIVRIVRERSPESKVLLMAIFPRGPKSGRFRKGIRRTNVLLASHFKYQGKVTFLDIGPKLLAPDGSLPAAVMPDGVHPSEAGYSIWADALIAAGLKP